jgi:AcrR family transcriptional regulator
VRSIAAAAGVNLERIYAYFGDKEHLYFEVLEEGRSQMLAAVALDPTRVEDYVGKLFDYIAEHDELARLSMWGYLEGIYPDLSEDHPRVAHYRMKLAAIRDAQEAGAVDSGWRDTDLLTFLGALASAWHRSSPEVRLIDEKSHDDTSNRFHREAAVRAARRLIAPEDRLSDDAVDSEA